MLSKEGVPQDYVFITVWIFLGVTFWLGLGVFLIRLLTMA